MVVGQKIAVIKIIQMSQLYDKTIIIFKKNFKATQKKKKEIRDRMKTDYIYFFLHKFRMRIEIKQNKKQKPNLE